MQCHYQTHDNYVQSISLVFLNQSIPILYIELLHELDHPKSEKETKKYK